MMIIRTIVLMITCCCGAIMVCCVFPTLGNKVIDYFEFIVNRRKMYRAYLQRLDDFEQYSPYMEKVEKEHQVQWLLDIQEQAEKQRFK